MKTILITGGSGLIGRHLTKKLISQGYAVNWLTRKLDPNYSIKQFTWDYRNKKIEIEAFEKADAIIHLAGANIIGQRWSQRYKQEIYDSRVLSARFLWDIISQHSIKIKTFIGGSGAGYYGALTSENIFKEDDSAGDDFLGKTCHDWEQASFDIAKSSIRTLVIRTGVVMFKDSEAYKKLVLPIRYGVGAAIGTGKQYFPWIHIDDLCGIYIKALEDATMQGAYNAVAPQHLTNQELTTILAHHLHKPLWMPNIPGFVIRLFFGEMADSLLKGSRLSSDKITKAGYHFIHPTMEHFLETIM